MIKMDNKLSENEKYEICVKCLRETIHNILRKSQNNQILQCTLCKKIYVFDVKEQAKEMVLKNDVK